MCWKIHWERLFGTSKHMQCVCYCKLSWPDVWVFRLHQCWWVESRKRIPWCLVIGRKHEFRESCKGITCMSCGVVPVMGWLRLAWIGHVDSKVPRFFISDMNNFNHFNKRGFRVSPVLIKLESSTKTSRWTACLCFEHCSVSLHRIWERGTISPNELPIDILAAQ